jgi:hypothetical protein
MADEMPDFVKRALIDDRLAQLQADRDDEIEEYLATLPTPIHLIVDLPELNDRTEHNHAEYVTTQRELLAGEVRCDALRRRLAVLREERIELDNRRRGLESNV